MEEKVWERDERALTKETTSFEDFENGFIRCEGRAGGLVSERLSMATARRVFHRMDT